MVAVVPQSAVAICRYTRNYVDNSATGRTKMLDSFRARATTGKPMN